ncbi:MAG: hemerythrin domain-containing protein [Rhizobiales bacterium]|nr:hemerythrin domain-containing protein [Hyphomicrobiales bacterium]NRB13183.1 hemerythrin domain-containing protein [Hyphomicrobiales bacterium]
MLMDYQNPTFHVAKRDGLPRAIRQTLLEEAQTEWQKHPRYAGKARFFMNIHRQLIDGSLQLSSTLERVLDMNLTDAKTLIQQSQLVNHGRHLIQFAHGHHEIEDHGYFPQFERLYPGMDRAFRLLDGDHKILDEALENTKKSLDALVQHGISTDSTAKLYNHAHQLKKIMIRHIADEEEIIIPIFLRHG